MLFLITGARCGLSDLTLSRASNSATKSSKFVRPSGFTARTSSSVSKRLLIERKGPTRKIENFDQVQQFLAHHGFETIVLEEMSIVEQILLFQNAEFVIGTHGAGLTNL